MDYNLIRDLFLELGYEAQLSEEGDDQLVTLSRDVNVLKAVGDWIALALESAFDNEYRDMDTVREVTDAVAMAKVTSGLNGTYLVWPN